MRQIVLDTETTGLDPLKGHRVIEVGCLEMVNRRITGNHYHQYLNPERAIDAGALNIHGLSNDFLKDKPKFKEVVDDLIAFIDGAELIIHNAPFDIGFLNHEFRLSQKPLKMLSDHCSVIDTLKLARDRHPGQRNSLDALCKRYNVDNSHRKLHGALLDAEILALVYIAMTGGQVALFGTEMTSSISQQAQVALNTLTSDKPLAVLNANAEEIAEHEAYLAKIKESAGECLWSEED